MKAPALLLISVAGIVACNRGALPGTDASALDSSGDSVDGPTPGTCTQAGCGGEITGTWVFNGFCDPVLPSPFIFCSPSVTPSLSLRPTSFAFSVTFDGKGNFSQEGAVSGEFAVLTMPKGDCHGGVPCQLADNYPGVSGNSDTTCSSPDGKNCECRASTTLSLDLVGSYAALDSHSHLGWVVEIGVPGMTKTPYCVVGDTLVLGGGYPIPSVAGAGVDLFGNEFELAMSQVAAMFTRAAAAPDFSGIFPRDMSAESPVDLWGVPPKDLTSNADMSFYCNTNSDCTTTGRTFCYTDLHTCGCYHKGDCPNGTICQSTFVTPTQGMCVPGCDPGGTACPGGGAYICCPVPQSVSMFYQCFDMERDVNNCGGCGSNCSATSGTPSCSGGMCQIACNTGFGDCDGEVVNGCEANLMTNRLHCGMCTTVCANGMNCLNGLCT